MEGIRRDDKRNAKWREGGRPVIKEEGGKSVRHKEMGEWQELWKR